MLLSALAVTAATPQFLTVRNSDGSTPSYAISDIRKVTFGSGPFGSGPFGSLSIYRKSTSSVMQYPYMSLDCLTFDEEQAGVDVITAVENTMAINYMPQSQTVEILAPDNISHVAVYGIGGNMAVSLSPGSCSAVVDLSAVAPGIYIVKAVTATASVTEKIVKR